jgi:hypothetical protein
VKIINNSGVLGRIATVPESLEFREGTVGTVVVTF